MIRIVENFGEQVFLAKTPLNDNKEPLVFLGYNTMIGNEQEVETIITDLQSALARMRELSDAETVRQQE